MSSKYKKTIIFIIFAAVYASFLICSSYKTNYTYQKIDQKEISESVSELDKLYIEGDISGMTKALGEREIKVKYEGKNKIFEKYATIKVQGSSSVAYEKKNYTIKFYENDNYNAKFKVDLGWGEESKYVIKANWIDKTHSRNIVTARIAAQVQSKYNLLSNAPNNGLIDGYPIEVYLNGEFYGLYTMNIPKDEWLYDMDDKNENHIVMVAEELTNMTTFKENATYDYWSCEVGTANQETLAKFNRFTNFIMNSTDEEFKNNIDDYLNVDATINYYVILQTFYISDNIGKNLVLITYDGKIWYPTLYDLDASFGTQFNGRKEFEYDQLIDMDISILFKRLRENFSNEIADRYFELRSDILTEQNIYNQIDSFYNLIPKTTFIKEQHKWGEDIPGYDIEQMKTYISNRLPVIDQYMKELYTKEPICIDNGTTYCKLFNQTISKQT